MISARDGHPLLLAAGELAGETAGPIGQLDRIQQFGRAAPITSAGQLDDHFDVFLGGQRRDQIEELEDEPHVVAAELAQCARPAPRNILSGNVNRTAVGLLDAADDVEQGGFARPAFPDDRHQFTGFDVQVDAAQRMYRRCCGSEGLVDTVQRNPTAR